MGNLASSNLVVRTRKRAIRICTFFHLHRSSDNFESRQFYRFLNSLQTKTIIRSYFIAVSGLTERVFLRFSWTDFWACAKKIYIGIICFPISVISAAGVRQGIFLLMWIRSRRIRAALWANGSKTVLSRSAFQKSIWIPFGKSCWDNI